MVQKHGTVLRKNILKEGTRMNLLKLQTELLKKENKPFLRDEVLFTKYGLYALVPSTAPICSECDIRENTRLCHKVPCSVFGGDQRRIAKLLVKTEG